jgi:hypothetical protein
MRFTVPADDMTSRHKNVPIYFICFF